MHEIIERYGRSVEIIVVMMLLIALLVLLLKADTSGYIYGEFTDLLESFFDKAEAFIPTVS
jgi:hypothetical protein